MRSAIKSSTRASIRSGIAKSVVVPKVKTRSSHLALRDELHTPKGIATSHDSKAAVAVKSSVFFALATSNGRTGVS